MTDLVYLILTVALMLSVLKFTSVVFNRVNKKEVSQTQLWTNLKKN